MTVWAVRIRPGAGEQSVPLRVLTEERHLLRRVARVCHLQPIDRHRRAEAIELCDEVLLIERGKIIARGDPAELLCPR